MNTAIILTIVLLAALAAALGAAWHAARRETLRLAEEKKAAETTLRDAEERILRQTEARIALERELSAAKAASEAEIAALRARSAEEREAEKARREQEEQTLRLQFKALATEILGEQSKQFKQTNRESMDLLLKPFRENIAEFRERVEKIYSAQTEQGGALKNELRNLMELNRRITTETTNLTNALKGNSKIQGDWGEMILETILDNSNLIKGVHYDTQHNLKDASGNNLRPDVILYLPEGKRIVIDSKVSLTAFVNCTGAEDEASRAQHLARHVASVRQHVRELSAKAYQKLLA